MSQEYTPVFHYNFVDSFDPHHLEYKVAHDGNLSRTTDGLRIHSKKYTAHTTPGPNGLLDHIKLLAFSRKVYNVKQGEFIYEAYMTARQLITPDMVPLIYRNRIRNIYEDYRLCCSGLVVYDEESMITAKILFTNDWIYGYYERRPGYKPTWNVGTKRHDYAAFSSVIPLCKRTQSNNFYLTGPASQSSSDELRNGECTQKCDDYMRVGIGIDVGRGTIKFYVNRVEMFCIPRIGCRLGDNYQVSDYGGIPRLVTPRSLRFGFGHFSYLDHHLPNNYARQYVETKLNDQGYPVHRLASALAQLLPSDLYREPYPNFAGEHVGIDPSVTFAYSGSHDTFFNFGQGMITSIKSIVGYIAHTPAKLYKMVDTIINDESSHVSSYESSDESSDVSSVESSFQQSESIPSTNVSKSEDSIRELLQQARAPIPLYREMRGGSSIISAMETSESLSSYSLGDLYKRSRGIK